MVTTDATRPRRMFGAFSCYLPRRLTLLVVLVIVALVALSNLSYDAGDYGGAFQDKAFQDKSYGWPLIWHRFVIAVSRYDRQTVGWYFSPGRLIVNVVLWLVMLAAAGFGCEWLLRRYRPRFCWSLRTMLGLVGLAAVFFAWLTDALDRANVQDRLTGTEYAGWLLSHSPHGVERCGPKWLDLLGVDRLHRHIFYGRMGLMDEQLFRQLTRLPRLRWLSCEVTHFTPEMAASLNKMRRLKHLEIEHASSPDQTGDGTVFTAVEPSEQARSERLRCPGALPPLHALTELRELEVNGFRLEGASLQGLTSLKSLTLVSPDNLDQRALHECLAAIGNATQLEHLFLACMTIDRESLACLAGLTKLKTLCLVNIERTQEPILRHLPPLPRLEGLHLGGQSFGDQDIRQLARLPRLKSLALAKTCVTAEGVASLASLDSLEELTMDDKWGPDDSHCYLVKLRSVLALRTLRKLHLNDPSFAGYYAEIMLDDGHQLSVPEDDLDEYRHVLQSLRTAMPELTIDGTTDLIYWSRRDNEPFKFSGDDWVAIRSSSWLPRSSVPWMTDAERAAFEAEGGWARFDAAGRRDDDGRMMTVSF